MQIALSVGWQQLVSFDYFSQPLRTEAVVSEAEPEESLGPIEPPYPSPRYKRNYTVFLTQVCCIILSYMKYCPVGLSKLEFREQT